MLDSDLGWMSEQHVLLGGVLVFCIWSEEDTSGGHTLHHPGVMLTTNNKQHLFLHVGQEKCLPNGLVSHW